MVRTGYIGIDVGGTKTRLLLLDAKFRVLENTKLKTLSKRDAETFTRVLKESLSFLMDRAHGRCAWKFRTSALDVLGLSTPDGSVKDNIDFLKNYSFRAVIAKHTGVNVMVTNDVAAGLYGEHQLGAAVGLNMRSASS